MFDLRVLRKDGSANKAADYELISSFHSTKAPLQAYAQAQKETLDTWGGQEWGQVYIRVQPPMRDILVPQLGQAPRVAGRPFLRVTFSGFFISRLVRHLKQ